MRALFVLLFMIAYGFTDWYWIVAWVIALLYSEFEPVVRWYIDHVWTPMRYDRKLREWADSVENEETVF